MEKYTVYKHTTPNNKVYIGITKRPLEVRWNYGRGYIKQEAFFNAILKYGWDNIKHDILFTGLSEKEAKNKEKALIKKYKSNNPKYGYNRTIGGDTTWGRPSIPVKATSIKHGKILHFNSINEASRLCNVGTTAISNCCRGIAKYAGGFTWEYE